jgi:tetratricopeptide (TPR) repeat protein
MSGAEQQQLTKNYTKNAEAYQLFLKGRYHTEKYTPQDLRKAMAYFQQAIALDPSYAAGYANLGGNYYLLAREEDFPVRESMLKAKENVLKAISLDDRVWIAHEVLGLILWYHEYDYAAGERELKRALEIDPNDSSARETYSRFLSSLDKHEEALAEAQRAAVISPLSPSIISSIGYALLAARRYDEAVVQFKKSIELDAYLGFVHSGLAATYQMQQNYAESIEERAKVAEILGDKKGAAFIRESFAKGGWQGFLRAMTENSRAPKVKPMFKAGMYAELGNKDKAFEILNSLYEERSPSLLEIKVNPTLDSLRDDPRFRDLLRRVGLPQ